MPGALRTRPKSCPSIPTAATFWILRHHYEPRIFKYTENQTKYGMVSLEDLLTILRYVLVW